MKVIYAKIDGISCNHCIETITNELLKNEKIQKVKIINNIAHIKYENKLTFKEIVEPINSLDYYTEKDYISTNLKDLNSKIKFKELIIILAIIIAVYILFRLIFKINIFTIMPSIDETVKLPLLFLIGILTSLHCLGMCGAINLATTVSSNKQNKFKRPLLYNLGRLTSYTLIGGIAGFIGSILSINRYVQGIFIILASILMLLISLKMLGLINFKLNIFNIKRRSSNAYLIGLLNGLMPCAPLQAMQLYCIGTGSFLKGALSMFLFCLGTIPTLLSVGFIFNFIKGKKRIVFNKIASILILILSLFMLNRGLLSVGIDTTSILVKTGIMSYDEEDYQVVEITLDMFGYKDFTVHVNKPVKLIINAPERFLYTCMNTVMFKEYNIKQQLHEGRNEIIFTPTKTGTFTYSCSMEMYVNHYTVIE